MIEPPPAFTFPEEDVFMEILEFIKSKNLKCSEVCAMAQVIMIDAAHTAKTPLHAFKNVLDESYKIYEARMEFIPEGMGDFPKEGNGKD